MIFPSATVTSASGIFPFVSFTETTYFVSTVSPGTSMFPSPSVSFPSCSSLSVTLEPPSLSVISSDKGGKTTRPLLSVTPLNVLGVTASGVAVSVCSEFSVLSVASVFSPSVGVSSVSGCAIVSVTVTLIPFAGELSALFCTITDIRSE